MAEPAPAGSPGQARPRSPSKVRRLAENWHSAPIIETTMNSRRTRCWTRARTTWRPWRSGREEPTEARHRRRRLDAPAAGRVARYADGGEREGVERDPAGGAARQPEIVVVSAPPDIVNISISGESLRADTPEPDEAEPPPPPPPPPLVFESPERPVPPAVAPVAPPPRVPRAMSEQRDRSSDFEPLRFLGKGTFGAVVSSGGGLGWMRPAKVGGTP